MIELYTATTANGRRATLMLEECGLAYAPHKIELGAGAKKPADFLKLNPQGTIPVIVDPEGPGSKPLVLKQSAAILLYLAEKTGRFLPAEPASRATALQWLMYAVTDAGPASGAIFLSSAVFPEKVASVTSFLESRFVGLCRVADARLAEAPYLAGGEYSVADVAFYPIIAGRQALIDKADGLANLKRWAAALALRPAVERALKVAA